MGDIAHPESHAANRASFTGSHRSDTMRILVMLRFFTAGESHGQALLAWISGLPSGLPVDLEFIHSQ